MRAGRLQVEHAVHGGNVFDRERVHPGRHSAQAEASLVVREGGLLEGLEGLAGPAHRVPVGFRQRDDDGDRSYTTALCVLTLEVYALERRRGAA